MKRLSNIIFKKLELSSINKAERIASKISTCGVHDQNLFPHVKALEYCITCSLGMCYMCSNDHFDNNHQIDWGYDIFKFLEPAHNDENELFNSGFRTTFDLEEMKCPCGRSIKHSRYSAM